ncbi:related to calcium-translocating P-type ATPase(PMCA-type),putative [Cephalotrichum gorgonifer]|uniref:Calcium-transporting ATPase n=1 Tax=Cephalotrichum gorgonifer TaxID=2041049 RepID=A0AAE8N5Y7_9PEZI|nr:related to calcium-translocating P-type ATPase(PMCA-type),putative [Cephalotrichum gorgonifer]
MPMDSSSRTSTAGSSAPDAASGGDIEKRSFTFGRSRANTDTTFISTTTTLHQAGGDFEKPRQKHQSLFGDMSPEEALRPDKGQEKDFVVDKNPFGVTPGELNKMQNPKSLAAYAALGGIDGIERALRTDINAGLSSDEGALHGSVARAVDVAQAEMGRSSSLTPIQSRGEATSTQNAADFFIDRKRVFKDNRLPPRKTYTIASLLWTAYNDKILWLLTVAAVVSLALGIYETIHSGSSIDWVEGAAITVAILLVVFVTAFNDWQKEKQFTKLNQKKENREVKAIRSGKATTISVYDVMVGDVLYIEPGDAIPADGIFISGHGVKCDESSATGESDALKKTPGREVWRQIIAGASTNKLDPFIISGSKVLEGMGTFLVTSVGVNSSYGKILLSLQVKTEPTPLQVKLGTMANWIGGLGSLWAGLLFFIQLFRFIAALPSNEGTPSEKAGEFLDILITAITIVVMAVPEGLPLAVTLALAFATKQMLKDNNLVRVLRACETMGNATTICSDKTGTLTQNKMTVVAGSLGRDQQYSKTPSGGEKPLPDVFKRLSKTFKTLLMQSIAINSTAFEGEEEGQKTFIGSKTEVALLVLAQDNLALTNLAEERVNSEVVQVYPFDSALKCMGSVIKLPSGSYRLVVKGASEIMLAKAENAVSDIYSDDLGVVSMDDSTRVGLSSQIQSYAERSLRTIGFLYRDFPAWPPQGAATLEEDPFMAKFADVLCSMTWVGLVGIQDPLRPQVTEAVRRCQGAGIKVRMVTGDNKVTAQAIAAECGIRTTNGIVMEGPDFRQLSDVEMDAVIPRLDVLARSSPEDKRILVERLKVLGETVAVTGDGTNDGPALKTADVGFSMGIAGTEVAKEASEIILMDDNFNSIVKAVMWGRSVNDAVAKFLQFQITVNIAAVTLAFVSAVASTNNESVLKAVQLLWVNMVMDTFAALALATDSPTDSILNRSPAGKSAPLITMNMWKMIIGQALYQIAVSLILYFAGTKIFGYDFVENPHQKEELDTMVFNAFVWMQIFNMLNNRRLDNKFNVFEGAHKNYFFLAMAAIMVGGQIMIVFVGGAAFKVTPIDGPQWAVCILVALPSLLWGVILRCIPDRYAESLFMAIARGFMALFRPVWKVLRLMFHPVAEVGRGIRRWRRGKKVLDDEASS